METHSAFPNLNKFHKEYRETSNIRRTKSPKWNDSRLAVVFAQSIEARC